MPTGLATYQTECLLLSFIKNDGNLVTWISSKQTIVARNSAEAGVRAIAQNPCAVV